MAAIGADAVLDHLIVPVDSTARSTRAVPLAARLADALDLPLTVVSVIGDFRAESAQRVETLDRLLADLPSRIERKIVQSSSPVAAIAEESVDGLVVMATGAELFDRDGLHSSVAELVSTTATAPVVVVGPHCPEDAPIERIVVGIDPDHEQTGLASWSTRLGYQLGVPVEFVHVEVDGGADPGPKVRRLHADAGESVAARLVREAEDALLAVGSHGHIGIQRLLEGRVGATLFTEATQPVMILGPHASR